MNIETLVALIVLLTPPFAYLGWSEWRERREAKARMNYYGRAQEISRRLQTETDPERRAVLRQMHLELMDAFIADRRIR